MKFLLQRVKEAHVEIVDTNTTNSIGPWFLVYMWISVQDLEEDRQEKIRKFVRRIPKLQLFSEPNNKKSLWLKDIWWELLIISNFTLYGRNKKAGSVDFCHAAPYDKAELMYNFLLKQLTSANIQHKTGVFGANMQVSSVNNGPVNIILER